MQQQTKLLSRKVDKHLSTMEPISLIVYISHVPIVFPKNKPDGRRQDRLAGCHRQKVIPDARRANRRVSRCTTTFDVERTAGLGGSRQTGGECGASLLPWCGGSAMIAS